MIGADDVAAAFNGLSLDRQRAVISALLDITVKPSGRCGRVLSREHVIIGPSTGGRPDDHVPDPVGHRVDHGPYRSSVIASRVSITYGEKGFHVTDWIP